MAHGRKLHRGEHFRVCFGPCWSRSTRFVLLAIRERFRASINKYDEATLEPNYFARFTTATPSSSPDLSISFLPFGESKYEGLGVTVSRSRLVLPVATGMPVTKKLSKSPRMPYRCQCASRQRLFLMECDLCLSDGLGPTQRSFVRAKRLALAMALRCTGSTPLLSTPAAAR